MGGNMKRSIGMMLLLAMTTACIHKQGAPVSAWERVNVNMAALAQVNTEVAKGIIAVQRSGTLTVQQAAPILNFQELVAKDHSAIENILALGVAPAKDHATEIRSLLKEIKEQGTALIQTGGLKITNPKSQQEFTQELQAVVNMADAVLADYELLKGE
jgi:hypothetical protein